MNIFCVGLSHHTADVQTRERFAGHSDLDRVLRDSAGCAEALLLTTCNRVEVYAVSQQSVETAAIARCLSGTIDDVAAEPDTGFYRYHGEECVQHLFRVASGLDSMVLGETEILGQAKKAYEAARASGSAGPLLHRLFQRAFRVAKDVRTHTEIARGSTSVGSVAVELAGKIFGNLERCSVLVVGAGETSERTARALMSRGVQDLRVTNRTDDRAATLAGDIRATAVPFDGWREQCRKVDILITSTSSTAPLLTREDLAPIVSARVNRPLFIIDIAVPRDVEAKVNELEGVYLYDIDSLRTIADQSLAARREQIAAADEIITRHMQDFWSRTIGGESAVLSRVGLQGEVTSTGL